MRKPLFIIVGGPNGAGKTTVGQRIARDWLKVETYLNADLITQSLVPERRTPVEAGKQLLRSMKTLMADRASFAVESTLSSFACKNWITEALKKRYNVWVIYVYLPSPALAQERVKLRVRRGGHNVEDHVVTRRYHKGMACFCHLAELPDISYAIVDNSLKTPLTVAIKTPRLFQLGNHEVYAQIKSTTTRRHQGNQ